MYRAQATLCISKLKALSPTAKLHRPQLKNWSHGSLQGHLALGLVLLKGTQSISWVENKLIRRKEKSCSSWIKPFPKLPKTVFVMTKSSRMPPFHRSPQGLSYWRGWRKDHTESLIGTRSRNQGNLANKCLCPSALLSFPLYEAKQSIVLTCVFKKRKPSSSPSRDTALGFIPS